METESILKRYPKERVDYIGIADKILEQPLSVVDMKEAVPLQESPSPWKIKIKRVERMDPPNSNSFYFCSISMFVSHHLLFTTTTKWLFFVFIFLLFQLIFL